MLLQDVESFMTEDNPKDCIMAALTYSPILILLLVVLIHRKELLSMNDLHKYV